MGPAMSCKYWVGVYSYSSVVAPTEYRPPPPLPKFAWVSGSNAFSPSIPVEDPTVKFPKIYFVSSSGNPPNPFACSCASPLSCACAGAAPANIHAAADVRSMASPIINLLKQLPTGAVCLLCQKRTKDIAEIRTEKRLSDKTIQRSALVNKKQQDSQDIRALLVNRFGLFQCDFCFQRLERL